IVQSNYNNFFIRAASICTVHTTLYVLVPGRSGYVPLLDVLREVFPGVAVAAPSLKGRKKEVPLHSGGTRRMDLIMFLALCIVRLVSNFVTILQNKRKMISELATTILIKFPSLLQS
ncbi:hypothetical protein GIB67_003840, partial [Kingdonia uniflora]